MSISLYLAAFFSNSMTSADRRLSSAWYISVCAALAAATASADAAGQNYNRYYNHVRVY